VKSLEVVFIDKLFNSLFELLDILIIIDVDILYLAVVKTLLFVKKCYYKIILKFKV